MHSCSIMQPPRFRQPDPRLPFSSSDNSCMGSSFRAEAGSSERSGEQAVEARTNGGLQTGDWAAWEASARSYVDR